MERELQRNAEKKKYLTFLAQETWDKIERTDHMITPTKPKKQKKRGDSSQKKKGSVLDLCVSTSSPPRAFSNEKQTVCEL